MSKLTSKKQAFYDYTCLSLVGNSIKILHSKNPTHIGIEGKILLETKYDIILQTKSGDKRIRKGAIDFKICDKQQPLYMDGRLLFSTLQTRIKKVK